VRTGTLRLIAAEGGDRRRVAVPARCRTSRRARSIVAALIAVCVAVAVGLLLYWLAIAPARGASAQRSR